MKPLLPREKAIWLSPPLCHWVTEVPSTAPRNMAMLAIMDHLCSQIQPFPQPLPGAEVGGPWSPSLKSYEDMTRGSP